VNRAGRLPSPALLLGGALLANLVIAVSLGAHKRAMLAVLLAALPAIVLAAGGLVVAQRVLLVYVAIALNLTGLHQLTDPLPVAGGTRIFPSDVLVLIALAGAAGAAMLPRRKGEERPRLRTPVLGIALLVLTVVVVLGAVKGHERYGAPLLGQPARLIIYAGIAVALIGVSAESAWRGITIIFYTGAVVQSLWALYYIATGTSQTESIALSTGGVRILALSSSMYLTGSLLCALLNLELHRDRVMAQVVDAVIGLVALFGIVVSFGRTSYVAVAVIVPVILVLRRQLRRSILWLLPLFAPVFILIVLLVPSASPKLISTLDARLTGTNSTDINVVWRNRARASVMEGVNKEILTGVGFGRQTSFMFQDQRVTIDGDPHNSYIYLLAGGGVLALAAFLVLAAVYVVDAWRRLRHSTGVRQTLVIWSLCTWLSFMINALTGPIFTDETLLLTIWILMLLPALVVPLKPEPEPEPERVPAAVEPGEPTLQSA
jgi:O-antigen ligase